MNGNRAIRHLTAAVVLAVAAFAAIVSYSHILTLARGNGQHGADGALLPLSVDGLIVAASLVLLHEARNGRRAPALARCMLWLGISATVGANISYGLPYGPLGALVSAWPAIAFVGSAEMAVGMVRAARDASRAVTNLAEKRNYESGGNSSPQRYESAAVPADVTEAAKASMRATIAAGNPYSVNQLQEKFSLSRSVATRTRREALAESNGHAPG